MSDISGRLFQRVGDSLVPADQAAVEFVRSLPEDKKLLLDHREPRHPDNHAHFFAILRVCCEQLDYGSEEELLDAVKIAVGHVRPMQKLDGDMVFLPKSINFASMGEDAFKRFKLRALYVLGQLLGVDPVTLLKEVPPVKRNKA